jgi:hypothetical protein
MLMPTVSASEALLMTLGNQKNIVNSVVTGPQLHPSLAL